MVAADLFSHANLAEQRKRLGMARAAEAQDRDNIEFNELAYRALVDLARKQDEIHIDDFLRAFPINPSRPNAMGSIWQRAIRDGVIVHSGRVRPCTIHARKNKHQYPLYLSLVYERKEI